MPQSVLDFDASGSWTVPAGIHSVLAEAWGAGGSDYGVLVAAGSGGGGGGAYAAKRFTVTPGDVLAVTVGAGAPATDGEDSSFISGADLLAKGGLKAVITAGGAGGDAAACIGDVTHSGGAGGVSAIPGNGGGGAGSAFSTANGGDGGPGVAGGIGEGDGGAGGDLPAEHGEVGQVPGGGAGGAWASTPIPGTPGGGGRVRLTFGTPPVKPAGQQWLGALSPFGPAGFFSIVFPRIAGEYPELAPPRRRSGI